MKESRKSMPDRLTVGRMVLVHEIGVRFPVRQQYRKIRELDK